MSTVNCFLATADHTQHPLPDPSCTHADLHRQFSERNSPPSTRTVTFTNLASKVVDPLVNNGPVIGSALQGAIQLIGTLSEIGRAFPIIAPAFVLLKIIVDLEKKAQDVDAKCNDLVERITFMLSHLPALQNTEVLPATQRVIDRVNDVLKGTAALLAAYRKQGRLARRLSLSNSDKFAACAQNINTCCSDLLMSLQIHQTVQVDILTRSVPVDEGDVAAREFVQTHGGSVDALVQDRELLGEFARQQHLAVDESDMIQLRTNMADSIQQIHARLESVLQVNVQLALAGGLKNLALEFSALEAEQKFICVQCEKEYTNYTNGPQSCSFHRAMFNSEAKHFPCCSTNHPCQFGTHRSQHHCDYPYSAFLLRALKAKAHGNVVEWASVKDTNLEDSSSQQADVGQLLRWVWRGSQIEENTLLVTVGTIHHTSPYYFATFTSRDLQELSESVQTSKQTLIFRTSSNDEEYASAQWILSDSGKISGICLAAKASTSLHAWIRVCPIDISTCTKSGDTTTLSKGGLPCYKPASPYQLPELVRIGPTISDTQTRPPRTDFRSKATQGLQVILKSMSDPPLTANTTVTDRHCDYFNGKVAIFNNYAPASLNPVTITSVTASYRMVGEADYSPATSIRIVQGSDLLPFTIEPRQSFLLNFEVTVPRTEEDTKLAKRWSYRAFLARNRPIRIKLVVEDMEGRQCSLVMEYVLNPPPLEKRGEKDIAFFYIDDPQSYTRSYCHVKKPSVGGRDNILEFDAGRHSHSITETMFNQLVYHSLKTGETEIDLNLGFEDECIWRIWALVDLSCCRVYAFKVILVEGKAFPVKRIASLGYFLCPDYGEAGDKIQPINYADEKAGLPPMDPYLVPEYAQDDDLDDLEPELASTSVASAPSVSTSLGKDVVLHVPKELTERLTSIDNNLARLADSFEKLLTMLPPILSDKRQTNH
ncbi:hypothetical protein CVT26_003266 [Gymnopilus dilepis]|uniref:Uncharacterized protein n=1 Tax=Gymnopilus dilepis TaxID=231916 RepID=A0A409Y4X2_9AGAR|nr:hypothetical protein CVT26_003266 [Gymnopilus dilepis]